MDHHLICGISRPWGWFESVPPLGVLIGTLFMLCFFVCELSSKQVRVTGYCYQQDDKLYDRRTLEQRVLLKPVDSGYGARVLLIIFFSIMTRLFRRLSMRSDTGNARNLDFEPRTPCRSERFFWVCVCRGPVHGGNFITRAYGSIVDCNRCMGELDAFAM
jgi:hypothetical protein